VQIQTGSAELVPFFKKTESNDTGIWAEKIEGMPALLNPTAASSTPHHNYDATLQCP
jgi:hypothetical protein